MNPIPPNSEPMGYNAVILGATGLVGSSVLQELIEDERCQNVALLTRKSLGTLSPKVHEILVDFDQLSDWTFPFKPDVLINCIGTTRKKTPSLQAYEAIVTVVTIYMLLVIYCVYYYYDDFKKVFCKKKTLVKQE